MRVSELISCLTCCKSVVVLFIKAVNFVEFIAVLLGWLTPALAIDTFLAYSIFVVSGTLLHDWGGVVAIVF